MRRISSSNQTNNVQTVEKITLDESVASKKRIFFIVLFVCLGIGAFIYGFTHLGNNKKGWQRVVIEKYEYENCSYDFSFLYRFGTTKLGVNKEREQVLNLYKQLTTKAYRLLDRDNAYDSVANIYYINLHVNEDIVLEPMLYKALKSFADYNNREIYVCALSEHYDALIRIDSLEALSEVDPYTSEEVAAFFKKVAEFAADEHSVYMEFLPDYHMILHVSDEYLAYAKEHDIRSFIDFGWMRNAFIADYIADEMVKKGFTKGILSSYDGFIRNFSDTDESYELPIYLREENTVYPAVTLSYSGKHSIVMLRDYPVESFDSYRFLSLPDGSIRNCYINPVDGLGKVAAHDLILWSEQKNCKDILFEAMPFYLSDSSLPDDVAEQLLKAGIYTLISKEFTAFINDSSMLVKNLYHTGDIGFSVK